MKSEIFAELGRVQYEDLKDMVYRMELTYNEIFDLLDMKFITGSTIGYTLPPRIFEISDLNLILKSILPNEVEINNTSDDIRLRSILTINKTIKFAEENYSKLTSDLTQSHSSFLNKPPKSFIQLIPGT